MKFPVKVIHVPFCYYPDQVGGTEVYVTSLCRHLRAEGVESVVAAPGEAGCAYEHGGLRVRRFAVTKSVSDVHELYGEGDADASSRFEEILDQESPDVVHQHAYTRGASFRLIRAAKRRGIKTVFTYHTPTVSCQRGTLLRWGVEPCDGRLDLRVCTACTLHSRGMNKLSSLFTARVPRAANRVIGAAKLSGSGWTALRMPGLVGLRQSTFRKLLLEVDQVVALCHWTAALLLRNGLPAEKLVVSPHGLSEAAGGDDPQPCALLAEARPLRLAFLGRMDRAKGPDVLVRALLSLPGAPIELHLYGITQSAADEGFLSELKKMSGGDPRVSFFPPVRGDRVVRLLRNYHLLSVPSRGFETGPLVVLEAFAAGTPVVGSNLGGIAELVKHEVDGLIVETDSVAAWGAALKRLCEEPGLLEKLRRGVRPPRHMGEVAREMATLYGRLVGRE